MSRLCGISEEMKSKMQWLRTQKRDLESSIMEMKSTISSLKDEQRIIEVALEEKQDEIKMLREKLTEKNQEDSQVRFLSESFQQKDAETDLPVKIWSVSADDPSNPRINFTTKAAGRKEATGGEVEELHESHERDHDQKNSTENIHKHANESVLKRDEATRQGEESNTGEQESQELTTAQEDVPGNRSTVFQTLDGKRETADSSRAGESFLEEKRSRRIVAESKDDESDGNTEKRSIVSRRNRKFFKKIQESETNERVGDSKQEIQDRKEEKNMDPDSMNESGSQDHRIDITYKTQQFKDMEEKFRNQIRSEQEQKPDMRRQKLQDGSSNLDDAPARKTLPNPTKFAGTGEGVQEGRKSNTNEIIEKGQEREANNTESEMCWNSQEVPTKTAASKVNSVSKEARNEKPDETAQSQGETVKIENADNLHNSSEHANIAERDVKADDLQVENNQETEGEIDQSRRISQEARYQKLNSTARAEEENNTVFTDTEQTLAGNLHSSSTHVKNAEMDLEDNNLDAENDKEPEDEDHAKSSAANLEEEGKDMD
ncbi:hypothetical protein RND71_037247 [Anisodus tanguticus]|uniref:Uncharacterized protein n=1 Tax=Anisodus tanguticus TaxID=243964 RepID=A0AAE1UTG8_9SOLA|nr:hypothetical protein RND71_037247 [Anisodus tanguticus]